MVQDWGRRSPSSLEVLYGPDSPDSAALHSVVAMSAGAAGCAEHVGVSFPYLLDQIGFDAAENRALENLANVQCWRIRRTISIS